MEEDGSAFEPVPHPLTFLTDASGGANARRLISNLADRD
jgi:hypothetical protein